MSESKIVLQKINQLVQNADQFNEEQFRQVLEGLVKRGGKEAEFYMVKFISQKEIPYETRANIIRCTGYIQNVMYLLPLKKVIDQEPNIKLKKAAIIALAKYNNERALNILNQTLTTLSNPILQRTVKDKISLIRQNHPILALTPRFLRGSKDMKAFMVSLGILKKILPPRDAEGFLKHKDNEDPLVRKGVFEILCFVGTQEINSKVMAVFKERIDASECLLDEECEELRTLTKNLKHYMGRFPDIMDAQSPYLRQIYSRVMDKKVKKELIGIFCQCQSEETFQFIKGIYDNEEEYREAIIEQSAGNEQAVSFLFNEYHSGKTLREKVIKSLLQSDQGFDYFVKNFQDFELEHQEAVVRNLPYTTRPGMIPFIGKILKEGAHSLKKHVLKTIKFNNLYTFKKLLMDPQKDEEYFSMETEYLDTIFALFPTASSRKLLIRSATQELTVGQINRYMEYIKNAIANELVFNFHGEEDVEWFKQLFQRLINMNNQDFILGILYFLFHFKTFDFNTYRLISDNLNNLLKVRAADENQAEEEKIGFRRVRDNLNGLRDELQKINSLEKEVKMILSKTIPDLMGLKRLIESNAIGLVFKYKGVMNQFVEYFKSFDQKTVDRWKVFFKEFPIINRMVREARAQESGQTTGALFHDQMKIVLRFEEPEITAMFRDQFQEITPHLKLIVDDHVVPLEPYDMLVCDTVVFKEYIEKKAVTTNRLFILLNSKDEFSHYKAYNPRTFFRPISVFRTVRIILHDLYMMRDH